MYEFVECDPDGPECTGNNLEKKEDETNYFCCSLCMPLVDTCCLVVLIIRETDV